MSDDKRLLFDENDLDEFGIGVWNAAIEAAAKVVDGYGPDEKMIADDIRELKR